MSNRLLRASRKAVKDPRTGVGRHGRLRHKLPAGAQRAIGGALGTFALGRVVRPCVRVGIASQGAPRDSAWKRYKTYLRSLIHPVKKNAQNVNRSKIAGRPIQRRPCRAHACWKSRPMHHHNQRSVHVAREMRNTLRWLGLLQNEETNNANRNCHAHFRCADQFIESSLL